MSRDIKFRAWHHELDDMFFSCLNYGFDESRSFGPFIFDIGTKYEWKYNDFEIMEFTGLKDANGVDMYEGDILECSQYDSSDTSQKIVQKFSNAVIGFSNGNYYYYPKGNMNQPHELLMYAWKPKVIGNIYENKDLL